jgi:TRAP-type C4-dicarboxylate transport system permease small subunit
VDFIRIEKRIGKFFRGLAYISGASVLLMMMVTVTDVFLRYVFNSPLGSNVDITQMAMVVIVFFALAHCGWTGGHVVVDILTDVLPKSVLKLCDVLLNLIGGVLVLGIAWQSFLAAIDYAETGEVSFTLLVPLYPFLAVCAFGSLGYAVVLFYLAVRPNAGKGNS